MNDLEPTTAPDVGAADLGRQCARLRAAVRSLLLAMVILSGIFAVFLYQQQRYATQDRDVVKQSVSPFLDAYRQQRPTADKFIDQLREFSRNHPDFLPLLVKYQFAPTNAASPAPAAPTRARKPATPPKKP